MRKLFALGLMVFGFYYIAVGSSGIVKNFKDGNMALVMNGISNAELEEVIINHYRDTIPSSLQNITDDAIKTTYTDLNGDGKKDVIATIDSDDTCGTGGCIGSIFLTNEFNELKAISFNYALKEIEVLETMTKGMHDLRINGDKSSSMVWNGSTYELNRI